MQQQQYSENFTPNQKRTSTKICEYYRGLEVASKSEA